MLLFTAKLTVKFRLIQTKTTKVFIHQPLSTHLQENNNQYVRKMQITYFPRTSVTTNHFFQHENQNGRPNKLLNSCQNVDIKNTERRAHVISFNN